MTYVTNSYDDKIVQLLKSGAVGFMPSDTIYGLSCRALDEEAVKRLHKIKKRSVNKPFIVLISKPEQLKDLNIDPTQTQSIEKYWPGPLTIIFDAPNSPKWLHLETKSLAIRMPDNKLLLKLIQSCGPLISTSANMEGKTPASSMAESKRYFGNQLDFYVDDGAANNLPSTIAKFKNGKLEIIRKGAVKLNK